MIAVMRRRQLAFCLAMLLSVASAAATGHVSAGTGTTGRWSAGASLLTGREEHTATLLQNGTILVAGGTDGRGTALASAETYNPSTNRWRPAGSMSTPRVDHSATRLANGKVLVAGGMDASFPSTTLASAELYDSTTNTWSAAPPMTVGRARHTAILLPDGRVLVVGGDSFVLRDGGLFPNPSPIAEIYDPNGNRWVGAATPGAPLGGSVTLLRDGRVLVAGGIDGFTSEIYDPRQDRWIMIPPMATGHEGHTATLLPDGNVLLIGGQAPTNDPLLPGGFLPTATAETFDPRNDRWSSAASMGAPRTEQTATLLKNGSVLVVGNAVPGTSPAEVYNPKGNAWSTVSAPMHRYLQTATPLSDGRIVIIGGYGLESLSTVLIYDPNTSEPSPPVTLNPPVIGGLLAMLLLLIGAAALSIPSVRQRLASWRRRATSDDWIT